MPDRLKSSAPCSINCQIRARGNRLTLTLQTLRLISSSAKSLSIPASVSAEYSKPWSCSARLMVREHVTPGAACANGAPASRNTPSKMEKSDRITTTTPEKDDYTRAIVLTYTPALAKE